MFLSTLLGFVVFSALVCLVLPRLAPEAYAKHKENYRENHKTVGCRVTHMFGIPMIALSLPAIVLGWTWFLALFVGGWILQLAGHSVFEKNKPVLITSQSGSAGLPARLAVAFFTIVYAVIFVAEEWACLLTGRGLYRQ
ncbi:MAG: DUF962 domain-containing protein [Cyanobacteria bacterium]|nr:DUF962 domain-containing protein [Cyanobacteriota bacterium]